MLCYSEGMKERDTQQPATANCPAALRTYYSLEKRLADSEAFDVLWRCGEAFANVPTAYYQHMSGWSFTEAALICTTIPTEDRQALLDLAHERWSMAHHLEQSHDSDNTNHQLKSPGLLRIETSQATTEVFKAMIAGDVTLHTRQHYYQKQLEIAAHASDGIAQHTRADGSEYDAGSNYLGLAHELNAMLMINRLQSPTLMAFPALPRADSGVNFPRQTHDINLFNMKWGTIQRSLPIEVKTTPQDKHFDRYDAVIIGGTMHLHPDNKRDPTYLTELLVKEAQNCLNDQDRAILSTITERVIHTARHGFGGIPQCRNLAECQAIPAHRPAPTAA